MNVLKYVYSINFLRFAIMCGTPWARAPEDGTGPRERGPGPQRNESSGPGPRVSDIEPFLGRGGHTMIILCHFSHYWTLLGTYFNVDVSETIYSGFPVKSSYIWACSPSRPSGVTKNFEKNFFAFLDVSDQKEHILFFSPKNNNLLSTPFIFAFWA